MRGATAAEKKTLQISLSTKQGDLAAGGDLLHERRGQIKYSLCPPLLCCVFVSRSRFLALLLLPQSMGADDRSKGDGFLSQKRKGYMAGQVRKWELVAEAVTIDGRKERHCRFCSETKVWTRSKRRRCTTGIPSVLQGKNMQAVSTKNGRRWSELSPSGDGEDKVKVVSEGARTRGTAGKSQEAQE